MSTNKMIGVKCALCKEGSVQTEFASASAFDAPDLDFRPSEMMRSTMSWWLMHCPHCDYVARDIRKKPGIKKAALYRLYQELDLTLTPRAYEFHRFALQNEAKRDWTEAAKGYLWTAWLCDDDGENEHAKAMRIKCLKAVDQRLEHFLRRKEWRKYIQLKADLLRRTENLEGLRALDTDDRRLDFATRELLLYQKTLGEKHDFAAHRRDELELNPFEADYEKKRSTKIDLSRNLPRYLEQAVSVNAAARDQALAALEELRPHELNLPYLEFDGVLLLHQGLPLDEDHPFRTKELAKIVNEEFLATLERFVVGDDTPRESVTEQNKVCMALLYQLYHSPDLAEELRNYENAQQRLYVMAWDTPFTGQRFYVGYVAPIAKEQ